MNHTTTAHKTLFSTLSKRGLMEIRHEICENLVQRRLSSLSDLTENEVAIIISDLGTDEDYGRVDFNNNRHRYILSLCYQIGWVRVHPRLGRVVVDNARLGRFIKQRGKYKKPILQYTNSELGALIKAMELILENRMK